MNLINKGNRVKTQKVKEKNKKIKKEKRNLRHRKLPTSPLVGCIHLHTHCVSMMASFYLIFFVYFDSISAYKRVKILVTICLLSVLSFGKLYRLSFYE